MENNGDLAVRHRPKEINEFFGNESLINKLNEIISNVNPPRVYLFCGTYGCGKTTLARLFASKFGINSMDIVEINCADFTGVDDMRKRVIENVKFAPWGGEKKGYILDEIQKLSNSAQNSLLKILEEPPKGIYFFLCTTEVHKILDTLVSRCSVFRLSVFRKFELTKKFVEFICGKEGIRTPNDDIIKIIQYNSEGVPRNILKMLDMVKDIDDVAVAEDIIPKVILESKEVYDIIDGVINKKMDWDGVRRIYKKLMEKENEDPESIRRGFLGYLNSILKNSANKDPSRLINLIDIFSNNLFNSGEAGLTNMICKACNLKEDRYDRE